MSVRCIGSHTEQLPGAQCGDVTYIMNSTHELDGLKPEQLVTKYTHIQIAPRCMMLVFCAIDSITCASVQSPQNQLSGPVVFGVLHFSLKITSA